MMVPKNRTGKKIGKFTVIKFSRKENYKDGKGKYYWIVKCHCGNEEERVFASLTKRSMCMECRSKKQAKQARDKFSMGINNERLYRIFYAMKNRCYNSNYHSYHCYGEKGISICPEWNNDYFKFKEWSLKNGYKENLTIDRIDSDRDYCPSNCRWATMKTQSFNKKRTYKIKFKEKIRTLNEISFLVGKSRRFLNSLILKGIDLDNKYN